MKSYKLVQDDSCHWYLIPAENKKEWEEFCALDPDDEASWDVPKWASQIDGPHSILIHEYSEI